MTSTNAALYSQAAGKEEMFKVNEALRMNSQKLHARYGLCLVAWTCVALTVCAADSKLADLAENREFEAVRTLVDQGTDTNAVQADGMSALHWAVYHEQTETARMLIKAGAHAGLQNRYGVSPLSLACQNGNGELVELLLEAGADPNTTLPGDETALMTAARTGLLEPVESLLAHGAEVNAKELNQQTALMWAAAEGHVRVVDALIAAGAEVDHQLKSGFTALFFAIREGRIAVTQRLLDAGGDVNQVVETRNSPRFGRGPLRLTPLLLALENGHFELAKHLLDRGADPNASPSGYTPLHAITWVRKPIRGDGDPSPTGSGIYTSLDLVRFLVTAGANLDARYQRGRSELGRFTYTGSTPFLLAAQASDVELVKLLLELGADPQLSNADGTTPLLAAAGVGALGDGDESAGTEAEAIATVELLLEAGLDINAVDHNGETVMHGAAYQSWAELAKLLAARGGLVDVWNHENRAGWTPRMIALGYRPGNFRPSPTTLSAIDEAMLAAGVDRPDESNYATHRRVWSGSRNTNTAWIMKDIEYARVEDIALLLDLYLPANPTDSTLIVWVHGGAWRSGTKQGMPLQELVKAGYTLASVEYRLTPVARFPAQVHDIKAAIRSLRFLSSRYGFRQDRIVVAGASAGGHLAALVGTTNGVAELEGKVGEHLEQSSDVQAVIDLFGPTNLLTILDQSTPHGLGVRIPALQLLLGAQPEDTPDLAKLASPVEHVDATDPPLLLIHGDQDPQVPINQAHELQGKYQQHGLPVQFEVIHGAAHGGDEFYDDQRLRVMRDFLEKVVPNP